MFGLLMASGLLSVLFAAVGLENLQPQEDWSEREFRDSLGNPTTAIASEVISPWNDGNFAYLWVHGHWCKVRSVEAQMICPGEKVEVVRRVNLILLVRRYQPQPLPAEFAA